MDKNYKTNNFNLVFFVGSFEKDRIIGLRDICRLNLILAVPELFFNMSSELVHAVVGGPNRTRRDNQDSCSMSQVN